MGQTIISNPDTDNIEHTRHRNTTQHLIQKYVAQQTPPKTGRIFLI
jgi:hypothetical protein